MFTNTLHIDAGAFGAGTGWEIKPEGICRDELCATVRDSPTPQRDGTAGPELDLAGFARLIGQPLAHQAEPDVW